MQMDHLHYLGIEFEAENYELYIKNADGSYKLMKTATDTSTKFVTATAAYGKAYSYKIRAIAGNVKIRFQQCSKYNK